MAHMAYPASDIWWYLGLLILHCNFIGHFHLLLTELVGIKILFLLYILYIEKKNILEV